MKILNTSLSLFGLSLAIVIFSADPGEKRKEILRKKIPPAGSLGALEEGKEAASAKKASAVLNKTRKSRSFPSAAGLETQTSMQLFKRLNEDGQESMEINEKGKAKVVRRGTPRDRVPRHSALYRKRSLPETKEEKKSLILDGLVNGKEKKEPQ